MKGLFYQVATCSPIHLNPTEGGDPVDIKWSGTPGVQVSSRIAGSAHLLSGPQPRAMATLCTEMTLWPGDGGSLLYPLLCLVLRPSALVSLARFPLRPTAPPLALYLTEWKGRFRLELLFCRTESVTLGRLPLTCLPAALANRTLLSCPPPTR